MTGFRHKRRVQFHETDLAGVAHFSWFFRYMEEAEHALWRAAGMSIDRAGGDVGWPRVSATFDFKSPLRFEEDFEVVVRIDAASQRSITYGFTVVRGETVVGVGSMTSAYATRRTGAVMQAIEIPAGIVDKLRAAANR
jgi:YbgC/YbaW family acyl-CoA thioester hydrolase